jgi:hypothetical protein
MSWHWTSSQQLEISVFLDSEHQGSKDELNVVWELEAKYPRSHGLTRTDLERFSLPGAPLSTSHCQIF